MWGLCCVRDQLQTCHTVFQIRVSSALPHDVLALRGQRDGGIRSTDLNESSHLRLGTTVRSPSQVAALSPAGRRTRLESPWPKLVSIAVHISGDHPREPHASLQLAEVIPSLPVQPATTNGAAMAAQLLSEANARPDRELRVSLFIAGGSRVSRHRQNHHEADHARARGPASGRPAVARRAALRSTDMSSPCAGPWRRYTATILVTFGLNASRVTTAGLQSAAAALAAHTCRLHPSRPKQTLVPIAIDTERRNSRHSNGELANEPRAAAATNGQSMRRREPTSSCRDLALSAGRQHRGGDAAEITAESDIVAPLKSRRDERHCQAWCARVSVVQCSQPREHREDETAREGGHTHRRAPGLSLATLRSVVAPRPS
ncbi:hypothetical protein ON010_g2091 [Phytophthora cinnamomi]|nr:hypothetical protein ON010_g2091 [Phytophthora cinnamomi]